MWELGTNTGPLQKPYVLLTSEPFIRSPPPTNYKLDLGSHVYCVRGSLTGHYEMPNIYLTGPTGEARCLGGCISVPECEHGHAYEPRFVMHLKGEPGEREQLLPWCLINPILPAIANCL